YRWSAVIVGFSGVLVMLAPYLDVGRSAASGEGAIGAMFGIFGALFAAASVIQTRALTKSESTASIVLYFSLLCTLAGLATLPLGWIRPNWLELTALIVIGICGGACHPLFSERYRLGAAAPVPPLAFNPVLLA